MVTSTWCHLQLLIYRSVQLGVYWGLLAVRRPLEAALAPCAPSWACWMRWHSLRFWARTSALMILSTTRMGNQPRSPSCNLSPKIHPEEKQRHMQCMFREREKQEGNVTKKIQISDGRKWHHIEDTLIKIKVLNDDIEESFLAAWLHRGTIVNLLSCEKNTLDYKNRNKQFVYEPLSEDNYFMALL